MATGQGTCTLDFGSGAGTNIVTVFVSSPTISSTSKVEVYFMGTDSTATHNSYEHSLAQLAIAVSCVGITAGSGFTVQAASLNRFTGTFTARYVWAD